VVENRAGSGGNTAAAAAINAPPDGYTLLFVAPNNAISTSLYKHRAFDFIRDTVPVASIMQLTNMLVVSNAIPVKTVQELIDYCKANPGKSPTPHRATATVLTKSSSDPLRRNLYPSRLSGCAPPRWPIGRTNLAPHRGTIRREDRKSPAADQVRRPFGRPRRGAASKAWGRPRC
jgi:Tripartite tricarboxylate transporter family receptor